MYGGLKAGISFPVFGRLDRSLFPLPENYKKQERDRDVILSILLQKLQSISRPASTAWPLRILCLKRQSDGLGTVTAAFAKTVTILRKSFRSNPRDSIDFRVDV